MKESLQNVPDIRPRPDPTVLTTAALKVAVDSLKELLQTQIDCASAMVEEKIKHNGLMDEKRHRETLQWFETREKHRLEEKDSALRNIASALQAQKELFLQQNKCNEEAAAKLEVSTTKQIDALAKEAAISRAALYDKIDSLKESINRTEGKEEKGGQMRGTAQWAISLLIITGLALVGNAITLIYIFTHK